MVDDCWVVLYEFFWLNLCIRINQLNESMLEGELFLVMIKKSTLG